MSPLTLAIILKQIHKASLGCRRLSEVVKGWRGGAVFSRLVGHTGVSSQESIDPIVSVFLALTLEFQIALCSIHFMIVALSIDLKV